MVLLSPFTSLVQLTIPAAGDPAVRTAAMVASSNTVFNIILTVVLMPLCTQFAKLVCTCTPSESKEIDDATAKTKREQEEPEKTPAQ